MLNIKLERNEIILIEAEKKEFEILNSTFEEVLQSITGGFHARIGAHREEVKYLLLLIQKILENFGSKQSKNSTMNIEISVEQLRILKQILNEACNGIEILNFEKKIGTSPETLNSFLKLSSDLYKAIKRDVK